MQRKGGAPASRGGQAGRGKADAGAAADAPAGRQQRVGGQRALSRNSGLETGVVRPQVAIRPIALTACALFD